MITTIKYACGHEGTVTLYGSSKERQNKIEYLQGCECPNCQAAPYFERAKEAGLPELRGTDKQIRYAVQLRDGMIKDFEEAREKLAKHIETAPDGQREAAKKALENAYNEIVNESRSWWWIDNYDLGAKRVLTDKAKAILKELKNAAMGAEEESERILEPENKKSSNVCTISIHDSSVTMKSKYDSGIVDMVKRRGYKWDGTIWTLTVGETDGTPEERAVEIANKLLCAGFPVSIRPDLHERVIKGEYEPPYQRWITTKEGRTDRVLIKAEFRPDMKVSRAMGRVTGIREEQFLVWSAPVSSYKELLELASLNGFRITPGAQALLDAYQAKITVVSPAEVPDTEYPSEDKALKDILKSSKDVLEDLVDD